MSPKSVVIGLTGPMCAGKNIAADILEKRGFAVVDADKVAHQALREVQETVLAAFREDAAAKGIVLIQADGSINRRSLGQLIFSDPGLLARHEGIIYPRINEILEHFINEHSERGVVINAPLLHKSSILSQCDFVIFIDASLPIRLFRALKRDNLPIWQIFARFWAQKHLFAQYRQKDVDIQRVYNRSSKLALDNKIVKLLTNKGY